MERHRLVVCPLLLLLLLLLLNGPSINALTRTRRMIFGRPASRDFMYEFLVRIQPYEWSAQLPGFQGVLYSERHVLTVASALDPRTRAIVVYCGKQSQKVWGIHKHPKFNQTSTRPMLPNDIALLELSRPFNWDTDCGIATLPAKNHHLAHGQTGTVASWADDNGVPGPLKEDNFQVVGSTQCQQLLPSPDNLNTTSQLCARSSHRIGTLCKGDGGAPFVVGVNTVIGLGSWNLQGCPYGGPAVFTNLASYLDWVMDASTMPAPTYLPARQGGDPNKTPGLAESDASSFQDF